MPADTALRLAAWFGTTPEFRMNLQRKDEQKTAEREHGEEIRNTVRRLTRAA